VAAGVACLCSSLAGLLALVADTARISPVAQSLLAILYLPEQVSGYHAPSGHAVHFRFFMHVSTRVILRLGYMRTYV